MPHSPLPRPERPEDHAAIERVISAAFATAEHASGTEAEIVTRLGARGALTLSLVAEVTGEIVGHCALSPVSINGRTTDWFGLRPLAVHPDNQRHGVGSILMRASLAWLSSEGHDGVVVLGDPGYYQRFGFASRPTLTYPGAPAA